MTKTATVYEIPSAWPEHYSEQDRADVQRILDWMAQDPETRRKSWLARASGDSPGTVTSILGGKYPSPPSGKLRLYLDVIERHEERRTQSVGEVPFTSTSVYQLVHAVCHRARLYRNFGVVSGYVGTGKTTALRHYAEETPGAVYLDGDPDMMPRTLLEDLAEAIGAVVPARGRRVQPTKADLFRACIKALSGTDKVIILDEAEKCSGSVLEHLRRIRDKAGVGIVLAGTERLQALLKREHGQFDQIRSRVGFWPPVIRGITKGDCQSLVGAACGEVNRDVIDACWALTGGSMRLLAEGLIPAIRDYGTSKGHPLDDRLVYSVGKQALGLTKGRG